MVVGQSLTSIMHKIYAKIIIFIRCFNITEDHAHYFTCCFCVSIELKFGAWITFLCWNISGKRCMKFIYSYIRLATKIYHVGKTIILIFIWLESNSKLPEF
jgi:hypothetical protein